MTANPQYATLTPNQVATLDFTAATAGSPAVVKVYTDGAVAQRVYFTADGTTPVTDGAGTWCLLGGSPGYKTVTLTAAGWCDSSDATWAAYYEPVNGLCYGLLYDRASVLARTGVANARLRLTKGSGTQKIYTNLFWANQAGNYTIPSGTAWTSTHWGFTYCPFDPARFHDEIAGKSLDLAALATVYPNA